MIGEENPRKKDRVVEEKVFKTYEDLVPEKQKLLSDWQKTWAAKAKAGPWKAGVELAKERNRTPGAGVAEKLGLEVGDMAHSVTEGWKEAIAKATEEDHEEGIRRALEANKWRDRWLLGMTVRPKK